MLSIIADLHQRVVSGKSIHPITSVRLIWSARSPGHFEEFRFFMPQKKTFCSLLSFLQLFLPRFLMCFGTFARLVLHYLANSANSSVLRTIPATCLTCTCSAPPALLMFLVTLVRQTCDRNSALFSFLFAQREKTRCLTCHRSFVAVGDLQVCLAAFVFKDRSGSRSPRN